jgi:hypothetical protein
MMYRLDHHGFAPAADRPFLYEAWRSGSGSDGELSDEAAQPG